MKFEATTNVVAPSPTSTDGAANSSTLDVECMLISKVDSVESRY